MTDRSWLEGWARLRACYPDQVRDETDELIRSQTYRKHLDCLTEHQWGHAVGECLRLEKFFPAVATLLEYGDTAPPMRLLDWTGECGLCEGTGFEPYERGGAKWVRHCPRGCKPYRSTDGPTPTRREGAIPFPDADGILERLKAICRQKTAQGLDGFKYVGIEADMEGEVDAQGGEGGRQPRGRGRGITQGRDSGQVPSLSGGRDA